MIIIAEKPSVARKIAQFLSNGKFKRISWSRGVNYYVFSREGEKFIVLSALGHLYTLSSRDPPRKFPTFNYEWVPAYKEDKIYVKKKYIALLEYFGKKDRDVIIATDFDIEGELIGYNIIRFALNPKNVYRMVFSAITPKDILSSFYRRKEGIYENFALAGETRHIVDWLYGINLSRALTRALRRYVKGVTLSIGRVQGPTLKIVFEREEEIQNFVPEYFYTVSARVKVGEKIVTFKHKLERVKSREEALRIKKNCSNKMYIKNIVSIKENIPPPHPYNLTDLQEDAYKFYRISPKTTLEIAQRLYERGYISYPRTSSQKIPETINVRYILEQLSNFFIYKPFALNLLKKERLIPNNGKKDDVHPAIHPTGILPRNLTKNEWKIYDLIVRRFLATFMNPAVLLKNDVLGISGKEEFKFSYKYLLEKGWMVLYIDPIKEEKYEIKKGEYYEISRITINKRKTKPPSRYNQASLIRKLESLNIGTKATRADIIQTLYKRRYIVGRSIKPTPLGKKIVDIFEKYLPEILSVEMTRKLERELEKIERGELDVKDKVIEEVKEIVSNVISELKQKEESIGKELYEIYKELLKNER